LNHLKKVYDEFDKILLEKRKKLRDIAQALGTSKMQQLQMEFALKQLNSLQNELLGLESQMRKAQFALDRRLASEQALTKGTIPEATLDEYIKSDKQVQHHTRLLDKSNQYLKQLRADHGRAEELAVYKRYLADAERAKKALADR